jgi:glucose 1-dehydrogenase
MRRFEGKSAMITGGAQGIGLACAERLIEEGARVLVLDVQGEGQAEAVRTFAGREGFLYRQGDATNRADVEAAADAAVAAFGGLDVLVSNVGVAKKTPFLELTDDELDRGFQVNLRSMILAGQVAARRMRDGGRGGAIVNMSSVNAVMTMVGYTIYNVSKGGIEQLTRVMALELAEHGIRVNAVGPGTILTELAKQAVLNDDAARRTVMSRTPIGRFGEPAEVASVVAFLASADASYVTGETVFIDGGRRALNYTVPVKD